VVVTGGVFLNSPTQELTGLGVANLAGAMFNCYTTTGSFSRSAVNNLSGAKSQLSGFTTGIFIMIVLLVLTPVFTNCPQSVQGAVVIAGVSSLFNYQEWWFLWKVRCCLPTLLYKTEI
jgi:sulfate transporter 4